MGQDVSEQCLRDVRMVVLAFILGVREYSVILIRVGGDREITAERCEFMVRTLKGSTTKKATRRGPTVFYVL